MVAELQYQAALLAWPAVTVLAVAELVTGGRSVAGGRAGRRSHCGTRSSWCPCASVAGGVHQVALLAWPVVAALAVADLLPVAGLLPAVALLHLVELVAWLAVELRHLVRIGGRWLLSCCTRSSW